jgi:hypothetical protein
MLPCMAQAAQAPHNEDDGESVIELSKSESR